MTECNTTTVDFTPLGRRQVVADFLGGRLTSDDRVHGEQENRFFPGYYKSYCFLPLNVCCGDQLLCAYLRPSNIDGAKHSRAITKYAAGIWDRERRVLMKAERMPAGSNTRFVVTNLSGSPQTLYDEIYVQRGEKNSFGAWWRRSLGLRWLTRFLDRARQFEARQARGGEGEFAPTHTKAAKI